MRQDGEVQSVQAIPSLQCWGQDCRNYLCLPALQARHDHCDLVSEGTKPVLQRVICQHSQKQIAFLLMPIFHNSVLPKEGSLLGFFFPFLYKLNHA